MDIRLTRKEKRDLEGIVRYDSGEARFHRRARMVLLADHGESVSAIAERVGSSRSRVRQWLHRFGNERFEGLEDAERSGRPSEITSLERHQVVATACRSPREFGFEREIWSHATLALALMSSKLVESISSRTVGRILDEADIKPHRIKMWCHSDDPDFQDKMKAIVNLYTKPPKREPILCIDEKTGMQALSRSRELRRPEPDREGRHEFEYKRNGTRCLFACFHVGTGKVVGRCTKQRKRPDFLSFMNLVASTYRQRRIHVVMDNLNTHRDTTQGAFITDWNKRHGNRFVFHYTPTHGSWLNQIELWFGIVTRRVLRYGNFRSPDELINAIDAFIEAWNTKEAHPFRWTYTGHPLVR
jgi:transposase